MNGAQVNGDLEKAVRTKITVIDYDAHGEREKVITDDLKECFVFRDTDTVTWINVDGTHDTPSIEEITKCFNIHPIIVEDILNIGQRPKIEDMGDYIFVVFKMLYYSKGIRELTVEQVSLILGRNFVLSFQEKDNEEDVFDQVRLKIRQDKGKVRKTGPDYLAYSLMDAVIDNYFGLLEKLGVRIGIMEEDLLAGRRTENILHRIHDIKREIGLLRKNVWPLREVLNQIIKDETHLVQPATDIYLRDTYDHTVQVIDTIESYREMIAGMVDLYLSTMSHRMNEVIKFLTMFTSIFIPLSFVAGFFGMNFKYLPGLESYVGVSVTTFVMAVMAGCMLFYFRKKKWL
jgi:magnesium transporter